MSRDPYHDFATDVSNSLASARSLSQTYQGLLNSSSSSSQPDSLRTSDELQLAYDKLSDALEGLRQDIEDVRQSVQVVEKSGPERFGVTPEELDHRKHFVKQCELEIEQLSQAASNRPPNRPVTKTGGGFHSIRMDEDDDDGGDENATVAFEREQQQMLMSRQDSTLDKIGSTLSNLRTQAGMMGQEIEEQIDIINTLDDEVEQSQGRLSKAMRRMDDMVRISDERLGGWCVWILIVILFIMLLLVILV